MIQAISQLPLETRIPALRDAVVAARATKEAAADSEAEWLDLLAQAEAQLGDSGVAPSGLIAPGENPYAPNAAPVRDDAEGDMIDPRSGEGSGDAPPAGSDDSPDAAQPSDSTSSGAPSSRRRRSPA